MNDVEKVTKEYLNATEVYEDKKIELEQKYANYKRGLEVKLREQLQLGASDTINIQDRQIQIEKYTNGLYTDDFIRLLAELPDTYNITVCGTKIIIDIKQEEENNEEEADNEQFKIESVSEDAILLTNNKKITYYHEQDCCEHVYADFEAIDSLAYDYTFTEPLLFEEVDDYGFRFGNPGKMVGVPCYNYQNGYYSNNLTIMYDAKAVIENCELENHID